MQIDAKRPESLIAPTPLGQIQGFSIGTLDGSHTSITGASFAATYQDDTLNNLASEVANGETLISQSYDAVNQASSTGDKSDGDGDTTSMSYNAQGQGITGKYDAWGRLVKTTSANNTNDTQTETFAYDALGREIFTQETGVVGYTVDAMDVDNVTINDKRDLYYQGGNIVQETENQTASYYSNADDKLKNETPLQQVVQYAYSPQGRMILRNVTPSGGLTTTNYAIYGPDGSIAAITDTTGATVERYIYDPTGDVQVLTASGAAEPAYDQTHTPDLAQQSTEPLMAMVGGGVVGGTQYDWDYFWRGLRYNPVSGLYVSGGTAYNPRVGRTMQPGYGSPTSYTWTNDQLSNGIGFWAANTGNFGVAGTYQQSEGVKWTSRGLALIGAVLTGGAGTVWLGGTAAAGLAVATTTYVGAVAGGTIGGAYSAYQGNGFWSGAGTGFDIGMAVGGLAPGVYKLGALGLRAAGGLLLRESEEVAATTSRSLPLNLLSRSAEN